MIEVQDQVLAQAAGIGRQLESRSDRPTLIRNSRILISLSFLGSAVAFCISLCMAFLACSSLFPLRSIDLDTIATAGLWAIGSWIMAVAYVFLWRQGKVMSNCSVLLDTRGAHFRLDGTSNPTEVFFPWDGIAEVRHKRIPEAEKFTILGTDTRTITFTSYGFYRPKKVARMIAARAGLPLLRG
ncbi:MAG: hypothetical protein ABSF23_03520 [Terracidiphilus sp.]